MTSSFFDELVKIGEENQWVTKDRLKRLAIAVPVVAAGTFAGSMAGQAAGHALRKNKGAIGDLIRKYPSIASKAVPALAGAAVGVPALLAAMRSRKTQKYIESGDDKSK